MTYKRLQATTNGFLTGDMVLTSEPNQLLGLLEMALYDVSVHADSMHLLTYNRDNDVVRLGMGKFVVRAPKLPVDSDEEMDIDNELCFAVARLLASYTSSEKMSLHFNEAKRIMRNYNSKVYEILESVKEQENGTYDSNPTNYAQ